MSKVFGVSKSATGDDYCLQIYPEFIETDLFKRLHGAKLHVLLFLQIHKARAGNRPIHIDVLVEKLSYSKDEILTALEELKELGFYKEGEITFITKTDQLINQIKALSLKLEQEEQGLSVVLSRLEEGKRHTKHLQHDEEAVRMMKKNIEHLRGQILYLAVTLTQTWQEEASGAYK